MPLEVSWLRILTRIVLATRCCRRRVLVHSDHDDHAIEIEPCSILATHHLTTPAARFFIATCKLHEFSAATAACLIMRATTTRCR